MKTEKQEQLINDKSHSRAEALADLPVTDEQARHAKGGGDDMPAETISFNYSKSPTHFKQ